MKTLIVAAMVVAIGLAGSVVYGQPSGPGNAGQVDTNTLRQFQKETLPLRDELAAKNLELRNEYWKRNPDQNRIAKLRTDIVDLRTKIQATAEKQGLPAWGKGARMAGRDYGYGLGMRRGAGWGHGPRMMGCAYGPGYYGQGPAW